MVMSQLVSTEIEFGRFIFFFNFFFLRQLIHTLAYCFQCYFYLAFSLDASYFSISWYLCNIITWFSDILSISLTFFLFISFLHFFFHSFSSFLPFFVSFILSLFLRVFYLVVKNIYITYLEWIQCQIRLHCYQLSLKKNVSFAEKVIFSLFFFFYRFISFFGSFLFNISML